MQAYKRLLCLFLIAAAPVGIAAAAEEPGLALNELEYLEMRGLNVMLAHDFYPEGHQGGVGIIQNGLRVATNGDIRLSPTPGQWQPVPKVGEREVDPETQEISLRMEFPDPAKNRRGFNPIEYPDLNFAYHIRVRPEGSAFRIVVDLDEPLPEEWIGRVGFNLELFPGILFGKTWYMDRASGIFPRQANGPGSRDDEGDFQLAPLATGAKLTVAPESERQRMTIEVEKGGELQLIDGRAQHNNGWFVVRALVEKGATTGAIEWLVQPHAIPNWMSEPVVQVSQVGYHPKQEKIAVIELDKNDTPLPSAVLNRISENGGLERVIETPLKDWGTFLRYHYLQFDFSLVQQPGMYVVTYGEHQSNPFKIGTDVFSRHVWQPTVDTFLPVQMCHMRVNDRYRVWHGLCHLDDARMAPLNHNHFDGYLQGSETLTDFEPGEPVPGLNRGGWHDAGDYDLRVESQAGTMFGLALAYEEFGVDYDETTIDEENLVVEMHQPDGKPDLLQQIEHGALTVVGGYNALGRFYRGIISPTLRQYVLLGDGVNQSDGLVFDPSKVSGEPPAVGLPGGPDDRWVFTEDNPRRAMQAATGLAAAARVLRGYNDALADDCLRIAEETWVRASEESRNRPDVVVDSPNFIPRIAAQINLATELLITTGKSDYADFLISEQAVIAANINYCGWTVGRALSQIPDAGFVAAVRQAVAKYRRSIDELGAQTPYGVPYKPNIWGAGWLIQRFGMQQYFLHTRFPNIFPDTYMLNALNFVLGRHPGSNVSSFVSGVGSQSLTVAYGVNRADWSYIPGGSGSGTALIRPDFPELLEWPFLWQQTEYVMGGGTTDYLILALAANHLYGK